MEPQPPRGARGLRTCFKTLAEAEDVVFESLYNAKYQKCTQDSIYLIKRRIPECPKRWCYARKTYVSVWTSAVVQLDPGRGEVLPARRNASCLHQMHDVNPTNCTLSVPSPELQRRNSSRLLERRPTALLKRAPTARNTPHAAGLSINFRIRLRSRGGLFRFRHGPAGCDEALWVRSSWVLLHNGTYGLLGWSVCDEK